MGRKVDWKPVCRKINHICRRALPTLERKHGSHNERDKTTFGQSDPEAHLYLLQDSNNNAGLPARESAKAGLRETVQEVTGLMDGDAGEQVWNLEVIH